jgi:hypothetical protein
MSLREAFLTTARPYDQNIQRKEEDKYYGWAVLIFCLLLLTTWVYVHQRIYRSQVSIPKEQLAGKVVTKQKEIDSSKKQIERNESEIAAKLEPELREIKVLLKKATS